VPITDFARQSTHDHRRRDVQIGALAAAGIVAVLVLMATVMGEPPQVDRLTVVNPTPYGVNVAVRAGPDDGRYLLGWIAGAGERTIRDVADQGPTWIFSFSYAGADGGESQVSRDELAANGWRVEVPPTVADRLAAAGLQPAYRDTALPRP
jgi:hypothetical protein